MRLPANPFRRVIALFVIALGLFWIAFAIRFAIWLFRDTTDTTRRILADTGIMAVVLFALGTAGLSTILAGVLLLPKKRHREEAQRPKS
jgi:hypothetical protein